MNLATLPRHDEEKLESQLRAMLADARASQQAGEIFVAEERYKNALQFAAGIFGSQNYNLATAFFHTAAFYASVERYESARFYYQQMRQVMRY